MSGFIYIKNAPLTDTLTLLLPGHPEQEGVIMSVQLRFPVKVLSWLDLMSSAINAIIKDRVVFRGDGDG